MSERDPKSGAEPRRLHALGGGRRDEPSRVLLVADRSCQATLLARHIQRESLSIEVACSTAAVEQKLRSSGQFDAAIVDLDFREIDGADVVWKLHTGDVPCSTVLIASDLDADAVREAFHVGIVAFLRKPLEAELLSSAVRHAVQGTRLWRTCLGRSEAPPVEPTPPTTRADLTPREEEVLDLLLSGETTRKMATQLRISDRTVKYHVTNVLKKLGARSRVALLASYGKTLTDTTEQRDKLA